jgi:hypothetical protein
MVLVLLVRIDRRRAMPWDRKELKYLGIDAPGAAAELLTRELDTTHRLQ